MLLLSKQHTSSPSHRQLRAVACEVRCVCVCDETTDRSEYVLSQRWTTLSRTPTRGTRAVILLHPYSRDTV